MEEGDGEDKWTLPVGLAVPWSARIRPLTLTFSPWLCPGTPNPLRGAVYLIDICHPTGSCEQCPTPWLPFRGSCYLFSVQQATWEDSQRNCAGSSAHLVIVGDLDEQVRSLGGRRLEAEFT